MSDDLMKREANSDVRVQCSNEGVTSGSVHFVEGVSDGYPMFGY